MKAFKVIVTGAKPLTGEKETLEYIWDDVDTCSHAMNFAAGLVEALEWVNGITANHPLVQAFDGYWWQFERGKFAGLKIKVVNADGKVCNQNDF